VSGKKSKGSLNLEEDPVDGDHHEPAVVKIQKTESGSFWGKSQSGNH